MKAIARRAYLPLLFALPVLVAVIGVLPTRTRAGEPAGWNKMRRDFSRMERELDEMLVDSPNFLVSGSDNARAVYLDEVGVVISFDATILTRNTGGWNTLRFNSRHNGVWFNGDDDDDDWDDDWDDEKVEKGDKKDRDKKDGSMSRASQREERRFDRGKEELREFLADYGAEIDGLRDDQSVVIVACMESTRHLRKLGVSRVVTRAKVSDLKARDGGSLSLESLSSRIVQEQY